MKFKKFLIVAPLVVLTAACSDDSPSPAAPTESYNRAFVKEFGVPAKGHDFSMARSAGLKVKASRTTHITVTAEINGEEYLFGDLSVPEGVTDVPVTIPSDINLLNLRIGMWKYQIPADGVVDLDNLSNPTVNSRNINVTGTKYNKTGSIVDKGGDMPILYCHYGDILRDYFDEYPIGVDNPEWDFEIGSDAIPWCDTSFGLHPVNDNQLTDGSGTTEYLVFPVYYRNSNASRYYKVSLKPTFDPNGKGVDLGVVQSYLRTNNGYWDKEDVNTSNPSSFGTSDPYYPSPDKFTSRTIVSQGHRVSFEGTSYPVYFEVTSSSGVSCSCPTYNALNWGDNYFPADLEHLQFVFGSSRRHRVSGEVEIFEDGKWNKVSLDIAYLVGFNTPPQKPNDTETVRDYSSVIYLVIPVSKEIHWLQYRDVPKYRKYEWCIYAEDLGGSFDWDFNDAVFSFTDVVESLVTENLPDDDCMKRIYYGGPTDITPVRKISVTPLAAGGTMPLYITYTGKLSKIPEIPVNGKIDYHTANEAIRSSMNSPQYGTWVIGTEIHKWLGGTTYTKQINTGERVEVDPGETISFAVPVDTKPNDNRFSFSNWGLASSNQPLGGFAVLVDKGNNLRIDVRNQGDFVLLQEYELGKDDYLIGRPDEDKGNIAPQMFTITGIGAEWPREYVNIKDAYPSFTRFLNGYNGPWPMDVNRENVTKRYL